MAKRAQYPEDKLLEAVVRYAEQHRGKIEATKLARWASENIEGLEGVKDRHFTRPAEKKDTKTGKKIKEIRPCTAKINELNTARNTVSSMNTNVLLKSSNIDKFLDLPRHVQREMILDTRAQVDSLIAENVYLRKENKATDEKTQAASSHADSLGEQLSALKKDHAKLLSLITSAMEKIEADERQRILAEIGVCDGLFDLDTYVDSMTVRINEVSAINDVIRRERAASPPADVSDLMGGFDFG